MLPPLLIASTFSLLHFLVFVLFYASSLFACFCPLLLSPWLSDFLPFLFSSSGFLSSCLPSFLSVGCFLLFVYGSTPFFHLNLCHCDPVLTFQFIFPCFPISFFCFSFHRLAIPFPVDVIFLAYLLFAIFSYRVCRLINLLTYKFVKFYLKVKNSEFFFMPLPSFLS